MGAWKLKDQIKVPDAIAYLSRPKSPRLDPVLHQVNDEVFATFGDWNTNGGPVPILQVSLAPLSTKVVLDKAFTEALEVMQEIDGVIYAPYTDPRDQGRPDIRGQNYFYACREHGVWRNAGAVPFDFTHVFGMVKFREKILAYGSQGLDGLITDVDPISSKVYLRIPVPAGASYQRIVGVRVGNDEDGYPGLLYMKVEVSSRNLKFAGIHFYKWNGEGKPIRVSEDEADVTEVRVQRGWWESIGWPPSPDSPVQLPYAYLLLRDGRALIFDSAGTLSLWRKE